MNKITKNQNLNLIISTIAAVCFWLILGLIFDFYYDLNDDVLIKDIISGVYTGTPDAHNNQMMYPISGLLVLFYRLTPNIPWFGLFEISCFIISFIIIGFRFLNYFEKIWQKVVFILLQAVLWFGIYLWEITMLQYTVVSGMLCAAATVWLYTTQNSQECYRFYRNNIPAVIFAILAFNVRSEMFLLMCPFMAAVGMLKWIDDYAVEYIEKQNCTYENKILRKKAFIESTKKYLGLVIVIVLGIIITVGVDEAAYSSSDWQEFRKFFDARTEVYDFTKIPDYEANLEFYENSNISKKQYELLVSYNFDLDKNIDAKMLEDISDYVKNGNSKLANGKFDNRLSKNITTIIGEYVRGALNISFGFTGQGNYPFLEEFAQLTPMNLIVALLYGVIFVIASLIKNRKIIINVSLLAAFRSVAWVYIYNKGRIVPRITHPMLMIEITILMALILHEIYGEKKYKFLLKGFTYLGAAFIFAICLLNGLAVGKALLLKQNTRTEINRDIIKLNEYTQENEGYYLIDVYSTVDFTEPVFGFKKYDKSNQQLAGGWIARSPLDKYKSENSEIKYFAVLEDGKWTYKRLN